MYATSLVSRVNVRVNGRETSVETGACLDWLVGEMKLAGTRFAIERNGEIVPKSALSATLIADGDEFEVVVAVGGG